MQVIYKQISLLYHCIPLVCYKKCWKNAVFLVRLLATGVLFSDGAITRCGDLWKDNQRIGELVEGLCPAGGEITKNWNEVKRSETWWNMVKPGKCLDPLRFWVSNVSTVFDVLRRKWLTFMWKQTWWFLMLWSHRLFQSLKNFGMLPFIFLKIGVLPRSVLKKSFSDRFGVSFKVWRWTTMNHLISIYVCWSSTLCTIRCFAHC